LPSAAVILGEPQLVPTGWDVSDRLAQQRDRRNLEVKPMANSWCTPLEGKKGQNPSGEVIGEVFFQAPLSASLTMLDNQQLDKLVAALKDYPVLIEPVALLLLGDTDPAEAPQPRIDIATNRAKAVEAYLRSKLPPQSFQTVKIEAAGKGAPFPKPAPGTLRRRVVEIVNKGKPIKVMSAPLKKAATKEEAFQAATAAAKQAAPGNEDRFKRIMHWIDGPGKTSLDKGDDAYVNALSQGVINLASIGTKRINDAAFKTLLDENHIMAMLMDVAANGNPVSAINETLLNIDGGIADGLDFIIVKTARESSTFGSEGLAQLREYVFDRASNQNSFYWIYVQGDGKSRVSHPIGRWKVKVGKWTWIYEFDWNGVRWTDPVNKQTGTGKWLLFDAKGSLSFRWDQSETTETWQGPLSPEGTKGTCTMKGITYTDLFAVKF
jgi:outer membrane protein OmpA-like peptidoglycan-associated protein